MYKSFTDEDDLEVKTRHDLTALMLDLEGSGRPSKPVLSVKCIDAPGNLSSNRLPLNPICYLLGCENELIT